MKKNFLSKKIYLNLKKTKYCIVMVFERKCDMQDYYYGHSPKDIGHFLCRGVSLHYEKYNSKTKELSNETGTVLLNSEECGAWVVTHELLHATLWARGHKKYKKQYPIIIKSMKCEENILQNHSYAVRQFYTWYYKVVVPKYGTK